MLYLSALTWNNIKSMLKIFSENIFFKKALKTDTTKILYTTFSPYP